MGGTGSATFKDLAYADLIPRPFTAEKTSPNFRAQRLNDFYYGYSAALADINRDSNMDVVSGPYYYLGPNFDVGYQFYAGISYNPTSEWALASMVNLAYDWTGDGWPDVLNMSGNAGNGTGTLYVNPKGESRRWDTHVVVQPVGNEETILKDIDGDGKPELIHSGNNTLRYSRPDPANPTGTWVTTTISEPGPWGVNIGHGMGIGDINSDGLMDYVTAYGWWEQPAKGSNQALWTWHPVAFARWGASQGGAGGAEMGIYDVNGDKLNDVVTSLEGHGFGLAWHEQKRDAAGQDLVRPAHDHGQRARQERRRRLVHAAACRDVRGHQPGRHPGHDHRQAAPLALPVRRSRTTGDCPWCTSTAWSGIRRLRAARSSCLSSSTTAPASAPTSASATSTRTARPTS